MHRRTWCFILLFAPAILAQTSNVELKLQDLLHEARARNPEIRAAQERLHAASARIKPAGTLADPQVGLQVMYAPYPLGNAFKNERALTVSQMFEFPGKLGLMAGMARREANAVSADYEQVLLKVLTEVKSVYFMIFHLDYDLAINRENRELMLQFIEIAQVKYATGMGLQPEVIKAQTEYSMMINDSLMLAQERGTMAAMLNALLDRPRASAVPVISGHLDPQHFSFRLDSLLQLALAHRAELKSMQAMADMYQLSGRLARREYFPDFMLSFTHRVMPDMKNWDAMISFNVPLYFWRKEQLRVQEAEANYRMATANLQSMHNMVRAEVESAFHKLEQTRRSVHIFQSTIVPQAEQSLLASRAAYENNKIDFLMLLDSQRVLRDMKRAAHQALADFGTRLAELERAVGTALSDGSMEQE
ncbi:MAG: TolC family protein [bacterium]